MNKLHISVLVKCNEIKKLAAASQIKKKRIVIVLEDLILFSSLCLCPDMLVCLCACVLVVVDLNRMQQYAYEYLVLLRV